MKLVVFANHDKNDVSGGQPVAFRMRCILCDRLVYFGDRASDSGDGGVFNPNSSPLMAEVELVIAKECMVTLVEGFMDGLQKSIKNQELMERES